MLVCIPVDVPAPAFIQVPRGTQDDAQPPQPGVFPTRITRAPPKRGHWGSSNTNPPTGTELEQSTKLFPHSGHSQGFP